MLYWIVLTVFYLWLGFTVGYFFRKWLETSYFPIVEAQQRRRERGRAARVETSRDAGGTDDSGAEGE